MTLYELTDEYLRLLEFGEDPTIDEQAFLDTLDALSGEIEDKADGYARVIRQMEGEADVLELEEKNLANKKKRLRNRVKAMKAHLQAAMIATGKTKFKTPLFSFRIQKNAPSVVMDEPYLENIPERFLIVHLPDIDRKAIKKAIEDGEDLEGIAHLEQGESLRIS